MASVKEFLADAGYRIFWTALEAAAAVIATLALPVPEALQPYSVIVLAAVATWLKEQARKRLSA